MKDPIGYAWLADTHDIQPVQALSVQSGIGASRRTLIQDGRCQEIYTESMRPDATTSAHLTFAMKHEGIHLELLARLFGRWPRAALIEWIAREPTGQYARRAGFFCEWLTGERLELAEGTVIGGNYRDALDAKAYVTAQHKIRNSRWRINDNLPGTPAYCPLVRCTENLRAVSEYDCRAALEAIEVEFGEETLHRSAVWMTVRESRASFAIEREGEKVDRIQRFAAAMARHCGQWESPLSAAALTTLQEAILGRSTVAAGLRHSPVFVGSASLQDGPIVHYVSPPWPWVPDMLDGLEAFLSRVDSRHSLIRAAVASFGFVFIHPLADGNGRVSRFLINDMLRRDGVTGNGVVLPVSATITQSPGKRLEYDRVLERYSKPLMARVEDDISFGERRRFQDGVESDLHFEADAAVVPTWRYPDLTEQVEYMATLIRETVEHELPTQAAFQRAWYRTREAIKETLEGPDDHIDRIIRSVRGSGRVSNKLRKAFPVLEDTELAAEIESIVRQGVIDVPGSRANRVSADSMV